MNELYIWDLETAKKCHQHSPALAHALPALLDKARPVYDFGCGKGTYLKYLSSHGFDCLGVEGTPEIEKIADFDKIICWDLSKPIDWMYLKNHANVISLEVVEHLKKEDEHTFLKNITDPCRGKLIISWALKGQGGDGHHNEQNAEYVIPTVEAFGFKFNESESLHLRKIAGAELFWFEKSIYVFDKIQHE